MNTLKAIASRKSTRAYKPEQISDQELDIIVSAGAVAPISMGRFDSVHMTIIQNSVFIKKLSLAGGEIFGKPGMETLYGAPCIILVSSKPNEYGNEAGISNTACIIENMCIAATDLGVGSVYIRGAIMALEKNPELLEELNLSEGFNPMAAIAIGYALEPLIETEIMNRRITVSTLK